MRDVNDMIVFLKANSTHGPPPPPQPHAPSRIAPLAKVRPYLRYAYITMLASQNRCGPSVARVGQPAKGKGPLGQERSERGQMAEAMVGGVEEEYRVAPGCISTRLVGHEYVGPAAPLIRRDEPLVNAA